MNLDIALMKVMLKDVKAAALAQEFGLTADMLFDEGKKLHQYMSGFLVQHGKLPALETAEQQTGISMAFETPEPVEFYLHEVLKRWKGKTIGESLKVAIKALEKGEPDEAMRLMLDTASRLRGVGITGRQSLIDLTDPKVIEQRLAEYAKTKALGGKIDGIPTPWETINRVTGGLHPDELWVVLGRLKSGKTWMEIVMALTAWQDGVLKEKPRKILLVSEEMGIWKIARRWDAVYAKLPYGDFKRGALATPVEDKWQQELTNLVGKPNFWIAGRARVRTVHDLELLMDELQPDATYVDGAYFLNAGEKDNSKWERTAGVMDGLQGVVQRRGHPITATWQFNRKVKTGSTEGYAEDVAFAYEVMQDLDVGLGVFRDEDMIRKHQALVRLVATRESESMNPLMIECDFTNMSFKEIGEVADAGVVASVTPGGGNISY